MSKAKKASKDDCKCALTFITLASIPCMIFGFSYLLHDHFQQKNIIADLRSHIAMAPIIEMDSQDSLKCQVTHMYQHEK